jgi:nucleoside-diphosphate-sugar epimerase
MNNVLIAGGAGFVGANLVRRFKKLGFKVMVLEDKDANLWRLTDVLFSIEIERVDFANFKLLRDVVERFKPSIIINTIAYGGFFNESYSEKIYRINFDGPANLLRAAIQVGFDSFVTLGSSEEYGSAEGQINEESLPRPINDYGVAKTMMTNFALKYVYSKKLPIYCVRPFAVYGDYSPKEKLIGNVFLGIYRGTNVVLRAPNNIRDFLYVDDLADLIMLVCQKKPKNYHIFNAGTRVPRHLVTFLHNVLALVSGDRDEKTRFHVDRRQILAVDSLRVIENFFGIIHKIHLVHYDGDLFYTEKRQDIRVSFCLFLYTFFGIDHEKCDVGIGSA